MTNVLLPRIRQELFPAQAGASGVAGLVELPGGRRSIQRVPRGQQETRQRQSIDVLGATSLRRALWPGFVVEGNHVEAAGNQARIARLQGLLPLVPAIAAKEGLGGQQRVVDIEHEESASGPTNAHGLVDG